MYAIAIQIAAEVVVGAISLWSHQGALVASFSVTPVTVTSHFSKMAMNIDDSTRCEPRFRTFF
jgi:hypothetical protein